MSHFSKRILVCPLDWGLGHATRCIPIIRSLLKRNHQVIIGADKRPLDLLRMEFPELEFITMPGYGIQYPEKETMVNSMLRSIPRILKGITHEHRQLKRIIREKKINLVISDNRYGLWSKDIPCVFITHQLMIKSPFFEDLLYRINQWFIRHYTFCWVPDTNDEHGLAGDLAHLYPPASHVRFVGWLSRFSIPDTIKETSLRFDVVVTLSGPEPQRTILENKLREQLPGISQKALIIRGLPGKTTWETLSPKLTQVNHLPSLEMQHVLANAEMIISRSGYSSIMDFAVLGKKAFFIPTPGQTEQEYLAEELMRKKIAPASSQEKLAILNALSHANDYSGFASQNTGYLLEKALDELLLK